jgi:hypothetical protein
MHCAQKEPVGIKVLAAAVFITAIGVFAHYTHALFIKFPPVWPDEALIADAASNLLLHGSMGTRVLDGTLRGLGQHTYLYPPLHYLYVAAWFRLCGVGLVVIKLSSLAAAGSVLVTTYFLGLRSGLNRWFALLPPSLLAVDTVFLRASIVGRMDLFTLELILLSLLVTTYSSTSVEVPSTRTAFIAGLLSGLAGVAHPIGMAAPVAVISSSAISTPRGSRAQTILALTGGAAVPLLVWGAYILRDPGSFLAQFGAQIARKASGEPLSPLGGLHGFVQGISQYSLPLGFFAALMWGAGVVGILQAARARKGLWSLALGEVLLLPVVATREIWYPVYLLPLAYLGVIHLLWQTEFRWSARMFDGLAVITLMLCFVIGNVRHLAHVQATVDQQGEDYWAWSAEVSQKIPRGAKVLLDVIPDPYFGLLGRQDLQLREFLPEKIPIDPRTYSQYMGDADYIVVGAPWSPSFAVADFAATHGKLVATVNRNYGEISQTRIYQIPK